VNMTRVSVRITVLCVAILAQTGSWAAAASPRPSRADDPSQVALRYARALAAGQIAEWAQLDLGCLSRQQGQGKPARGPLDEQGAKACWDATLAAHRDMVADEPEHGIFGAVGRGVGLGLLSERHRKADFWRDYPPAVFVSPAVAGRELGSVPRVELVRVGFPRSVGLQLMKEQNPVGARAIPVDLKVAYPDPLTAPLALRPEEIWWTSGAIRRYGPVRDLVARFMVVTGLRALGYPVDRAVVNEALPGAPVILGAKSSVTPEIGRAFDRPGEVSHAQDISAGLVLGSARWWDRAQAENVFTEEVQRVQHDLSLSNRLARLSRLLLLDPTHGEVNAILGNEFYLRFLREGLTKSGISAQDEATRLHLAELYWNLQAQTWRQELTEVATGYSPAAESLYGALQALEVAVQRGKGTIETKRRLGTLSRWNNDSQAALALHEELLRQLAPTDQRLRGRLLAELAWDRIQWIAWDRRYDHPWLGQAREEVEQALTLIESPVEKLIAAQALVMVDALSVPRSPSRIEEHVRLVKRWHDQVPGVVGLWRHLIGNDLVKPLVAEAETITLPSPVRSAEVLDVQVHAKVPKQDLLHTWDFDGERTGGLPAGFSAGIGDAGPTGAWRIEEDPDAPTAPNVLTQTSACAVPDCRQLLLADVAAFEYPDLLVRLRLVSGGPQAGAGIALATRDGRELYAVTFAPATNTVAIHRVRNGQAVLIGSAPVKPAKDSWHLLRVQRSNFVNVSLPRLAIFFDGAEALAVTDDAIMEMGRVGLVTWGDAVAKFDGLHVLDLVSNRPLSKPAAY